MKERRYEVSGRIVLQLKVHHPNGLRLLSMTKDVQHRFILMLRTESWRCTKCKEEKLGNPRADWVVERCVLAVQVTRSCCMGCKMLFEKTTCRVVYSKIYNLDV